MISAYFLSTSVSAAKSTASCRYFGCRTHTYAHTQREGYRVEDRDSYLHTYKLAGPVFAIKMNIYASHLGDITKLTHTHTCTHEDYVCRSTVCTRMCRN